MLKSSRKAKRIYKKNKFTTYDARQMLAYMAKVDHADVYNMYLCRIKPYVNIKVKDAYYDLYGEYPE